MKPGTCIDTVDCTYCIKAFYNETRCNTLGNLIKNGCHRKDTINYIVEDVDVKPSNKTKSPIVLPLLRNTTRTITINFILADHPVDVYYLMDFSGSMWDDKDKVVSLSKQLVQAVQKMSTDATLGFGSFVDKPVYPFGDINE